MSFAQPWFWAVCQITLAVIFLGFAAFYLRLRTRQLIDTPTAIARIVFLVGLALLSLAQAVAPALPSPAVLIAGVIATITGVIAAGHQLLRLPQLRNLPSRSEIAETQAALERANQELEAFTASVSHDLRSPLTTIAGQAGLLEMSAGAKLDDDQRRRLQRIHASVKQMSELIEALLNLSRISQTKLERERVDISAIADRVLYELAQKEPERHVAMNVPAEVYVHGDRRLLTSVMENLLGNAWKFTAKVPQASIALVSVQKGHERCIGIRDNGCGFDMSQHDKIFQPFHRLHAHSEYPGSGVGLATASRIIARHGGRIWAESEPGHGATFWFTVGA